MGSVSTEVFFDVINPKTALSLDIYRLGILECVSPGRRGPFFKWSQRTTGRFDTLNRTSGWGKTVFARYDLWKRRVHLVGKDFEVKFQCSTL